MALAAGNGKSVLRLFGTPHSFPDLPTLWDGESIRWEAWEKQLAVTHLDITCGGCGIGSSLWQSTGFWNRSRFGSEMLRRHIRNFHAARCGWCGYTTVFTMHDNQSWELDESDYAEHGSYDIEEMETLF